MAISSPLVSIIITSHNQAQFLGECLDSVHHQTYANIELIYVDNGSEDGSKDIFRTFPAPQKTLFFEENIGLPAALNRAMGYLDGEYFIDLAADDVLYPTKVERQMEFLAYCSKVPGIVYHNANLIDEHGKVVGQYYKDNKTPLVKNVFEELLSNYFLNTVSFFYNTAIVKKLGGFNEKLLFEDREMALRIARDHPILYQEEVLMSKRKSSGSLSKTYFSKNKQKALESYLILMQNAHELIRSNDELTSWKKGILYYYRLSIRLNEWDLAKAFRNLYECSSPFPASYKLLQTLNNLGIPVSKLAQAASGLK